MIWGVKGGIFSADEGLGLNFRAFGVLLIRGKREKRFGRENAFEIFDGVGCLREGEKGGFAKRIVVLF